MRKHKVSGHSHLGKQPKSDPKKNSQLPHIQSFMSKENITPSYFHLMFVCNTEANLPIELGNAAIVALLGDLGEGDQHGSFGLGYRPKVFTGRRGRATRLGTVAGGLNVV